MRWDQDGFRRLVLGQTKGIVPAAARWSLRAASLPYAAVTACRNAAYNLGIGRVHRAAVPVISVGNLTVGGTGKTPVVELLARHFAARQVHVAILSRGYGASHGPNDEALVLSANLPDTPHLEGRDRCALAARACREFAAELLILDDGFQHRRLHRDLDVVLLDAMNPFGGGWQLPGGLLRESLRSLRRASVLVLTRCDRSSPQRRQQIRATAERLAGPRPWVEVRFCPTALVQHGGGQTPLESLRGKRLLAFCGIGNPDSFFSSLTDVGASVVATRTFPDHHWYFETDVAELAEWTARHSADAVVVTQKDLVKLRRTHLGQLPLYALRIEAAVESGHEDWHAALDSIAIG